MAKRYRSSIPAGAIEQVVSPYRSEGGLVWYRTAECVVDGEIVGMRFYDDDGALVIESPLRNGRKHGVQFRWYDGGKQLESAEPFYKGLPHGLASQWGDDGRLLGTYRLNHGSGFDLWRDGKSNDGVVLLSEVLPMKDGRPHGYEWWLNTDQHTVWAERHWHEGQLHGIEREWNGSGRLSRGYPRNYIMGKRVDKRMYVKACRTDPSLPAYQASDNEPVRCFPPAILTELGPRS